MENKIRPNILFLKPHLQEKIWGGSRLISDFGYECENKDHIGECWGVSAHPDEDCEIDGGEYDGVKLSKMWRDHQELFGNTGLSEFPLLTKIIDAKEDLSIQVHPNDDYAKEHENSLGKTECWYILDCPENASLIIGNNARNRDELEGMIEDHRWSELCNEVPVRKGDFIQINPGTLHSIKGGFLILESQQSSDVTYRVYDFDREVNGKKRELHLKQSLDVIKTPDKFVKDDIIHTKDIPDIKQQLESNSCYKIWKWHITRETDLAHSEPFLICSVIEGEGLVDGRPVKKGSHFIIPFGMTEVKARGNMQLIMSSI